MGVRMVPIEITIANGQVSSKCNLVNDENNNVNHTARPVYLKPVSITDKMGQDMLEMIEDFVGKNKRPPDESEKEQMYANIEANNPLYKALEHFMVIYAEEIQKETGIDFDPTI